MSTASAAAPCAPPSPTFYPSTLPTIADRRIADYPGTLRYHLFIDDFVHTAHDLDELVR